MAILILKLRSDENKYVSWSTNDDWFQLTGTRDDMVNLLTRPTGNYTRGTSLQVMSRVDQAGTSDVNGRCAWDDTTPMNVGDHAPGDGWYHISRSDLPALIEAAERNDRATMHSLMRRYA